MRFPHVCVGSWREQKQSTSRESKGAIKKHKSNFLKPQAEQVHSNKENLIETFLGGKLFKHFPSIHPFVPSFNEFHEGLVNRREENCLHTLEQASFDLTIVSKADKLYKNEYLCWFYVQSCSPPTRSPFFLENECRKIVKHFSIIRDDGDSHRASRFGYKILFPIIAHVKSCERTIFLFISDRVDFKWDFPIDLRSAVCQLLCVSSRIREWNSNSNFREKSRAENKMKFSLSLSSSSLWSVCLLGHTEVDLIVYTTQRSKSNFRERPSIVRFSKHVKGNERRRKIKF